MAMENAGSLDARLLWTGIGKPAFVWPAGPTEAAEVFAVEGQTVIVVNTKLSDSQATLVAHRLVQALRRQPPQQEVVIVGAVRLSSVALSQPTLFRVCFGSAPTHNLFHELPTLPDDAIIQDPFLAALLHFLRLSELPTLAILAHGSRVVCDAAAEETLQIVRALGQQLAVLKLRFSMQQAQTLQRQTLARPARDPMHTDINSMYN